MSKLTHLDERGNAHMVDVGDKQVSHRVAIASGQIRMGGSTLELIAGGGHKKGDVLAVARIAGIQAAKQCAHLIPLCHPLMLTSINVDFELDQQLPAVNINASCKLSGQTGVEMEALTAVAVAALTIYDMCKGLSHDIIITDVRLVSKTGGKSESKAPSVADISEPGHE